MINTDIVLPSPQEKIRPEVKPLSFQETELKGNAYTMPNQDVVYRHPQGPVFLIQHKRGLNLAAHSFGGVKEPERKIELILRTIDLQTNATLHSLGSIKQISGDLGEIIGWDGVVRLDDPEVMTQRRPWSDWQNNAKGAPTSQLNLVLQPRPANAEEDTLARIYRAEWDDPELALDLGPNDLAQAYTVKGEYVGTFIPGRSLSDEYKSSATHRRAVDAFWKEHAQRFEAPTIENKYHVNNPMIQLPQSRADLEQWLILESRNDLHHVQEALGYVLARSGKSESEVDEWTKTKTATLPYGQSRGEGEHSIDGFSVRFCSASGTTSHLVLEPNQKVTGERTTKAPLEWVDATVAGLCRELHTEFVLPAIQREQSPIAPMEQETGLGLEQRPHGQRTKRNPHGGGGSPSTVRNQKLELPVI